MLPNSPRHEPEDLDHSIASIAHSAAGKGDIRSMVLPSSAHGPLAPMPAQKDEPSSSLYSASRPFTQISSGRPARVVRGSPFTMLNQPAEGAPTVRAEPQQAQYDSRSSASHANNYPDTTVGANASPFASQSSGPVMRPDAAKLHAAEDGRKSFNSAFVNYGTEPKRQPLSADSLFASGAAFPLAVDSAPAQIYNSKSVWLPKEEDELQLSPRPFQSPIQRFEKGPETVPKADHDKLKKEMAEQTMELADLRSKMSRLTREKTEVVPPAKRRRVSNAPCSTLLPVCCPVLAQGTANHKLIRYY
jgi:hypothetical protein